MPKERAVRLRKNAGSPPAVPEQEAAAGHEGARQLVSLTELPERGHISHRGFVESITILPAQQAPSFAVSVVDRPAPPGGRRTVVPHLRLIFLGQRRVPGIWAGTRLRYEGTVAPIDGVPTIYNPRYEILPARGAGQAPKPRPGA